MAMTCRARWSVCTASALLLALAPVVFDSGLGISVLSQMGIAIIACLSYNILFGQGGMLSFGHAVYTGLGSFMAIHALNAATDGGLPLPVALVPLVGGLAGLGFALLLGYVTTRKAGTTFAMITLGLGELVFAMALMVPEFFGGEGGVSANRMVRGGWWGITFGPPIQVYGLIAVYTLLCTAAMFAFTHTPLGRMLNAVRDNPERAAFVGYDARRVRYLAFIIAGFFAGISGGLAALNAEIVTAEAVGTARSGSYLLFTLLGGAGFFFGPMLGAILLVLATVLFSGFSQAWLLYLGLTFLLVVLFAPGGMASLIMLHVRVAMFGRLRGLLLPYLGLAFTAVPMLAAGSSIVEMVYHLQLNQSQGSAFSYLGMRLDVARATHWLLAALVLALSAGLFEWVRRGARRRWDAIQAAIEADIGRGEAA